ncbi:hypothetical protein [Rhodococcus sp. YL-1]|uniref:hypothetical protein n=1 Tax=Rhodococcus sp. YL-1 TaxID=1045808 RepID=UPI00096AB607|nr:hypothetical protein [Rhodococcus sp. YL-1]
MGSRTVSGYAAAVLDDPLSIIHAAVQRADPTLAASVLSAALAEAAPSITVKRRLAQALFENPELLTDRQPLGPPAMDRLIKALQGHGSTGIELPLCGVCHRDVDLTNRQGPLRICGSCYTRERKRIESCTSCGESTLTRYRDWEGRPLCASCERRISEVDQLNRLVNQITIINADVDTGLLREIVERELPKAGNQRRIADELAEHPLRLTTEAAHATAATTGLLRALVNAAIGGFVMPPCPFCNRAVELTTVRERLRSCRRCYEQHHAQVCAGCGAARPAASRNASGAPICRSCHNHQPENQDTCPGCGERARLYRLAGQQPRCRRCQRSPITICAFCGKLKECYFADTATPRCEPCSSKLLRREPCSVCNQIRIVRTRTADGAPVCNNCGLPKALCHSCHRVMTVRAWLPDGPRCKACYRRHPDSFKPCRQCGKLEHLHHFGLCRGCACIAQLRTALGDDTNIIPRLQPVYDALARSSLESTLTYLEGGGSQLLGQLRETGRPVTHQLLDEYRNLPHTRPLRDALVCAGALAPRDEILHTLEEQLHRFLADIDDEEDRKLLRNYATWRLLHKLRTKARRPLTRPQATYALLKLSIAADLLEYLRRHSRQLEEADQHDLDRWQMSNTQAHRARDFFQWATARRHFRRGLLLAPRPRRHGSGTMTDDERWKHARRLLHDTSIDRCDRFAGLLLLLFAQPSRRIVTLRTDAITQRIDNRAVSLALGTEPVVLPTLIGQLALDLVVNRYRGRAALAQTSDHDWLFPGVRAGSPMSSQNLNIRFNRVGISAQPARTAALMDLAAQMPAAVLAALLGIEVATAQGWVTEVGQNGAYAADIARRHRPSSEQANP